MTDIMELARAILDGEHDDHFDAINAAISGRKDILKRQMFHQLQVNDRVRVVSCGTKYLVGATATLVAKRTTKVAIQFDKDIVDPYGKWAGNRCILSPSMIEKIPAEVTA